MEDSADDQAVDEGVIRCICDISDDDGYTICCEKCLVWQHAVCVGITPENEPDKYYCEECNPRELDAQDERKKKEEERRLKRLEKQSPRKRNQSQEFDGRRKRKESGGQLSPRKRLKDSDPISKPKIERSFTETGIRDPIIKKKKQVEIRDYSSAFEAEYAMNSVVFSKLMRLCYTESTYQLLEKLLEDSKSWPLVPVYDPFADENQVKSVVEDTLKMSADLNHAAKVAVMQTSIPTWLKNATYFQKEPFQSGAKQFGLFSNHDLTANCFVSEICGRVSSLEDLYLKHNFLIPLPVDEQVAKNTDILPPFVFPLPKFTDSEDSTHTQLFLDARDTANFDARFVQASCDLDKVNAEFKLVVVINESEIGDRVKYDRNTSTTETDEAQPLINLSSRFKLCLFTTKLVKATDEIVIANPVNNFYHFSCSCTITCKILESVKIIEDFRNQDYADQIMQTPYYDKLQARQDDRQALIDKQLEKLQQVPNTWIYQSPGEVERLCKEYVADLIERGEMVEEEEKEELVPYVEVKEEDEEGQVNDDEISEVKDIEMETDQVSESEPEKEEPRRVSFQDFMRQLSSTSAAPPAIPSPIAEDVQEQGETSSAISLTAIDEVFVKAEQSPEDIEVDSSPVAELKKPVPARISLNSDAIRALASSLPLMSAPVISKSEAASPFDPRVFNNSLNADTKVVTQNLEPPTSAPLVESSSSEIIPQRVALPLDLPQAPETSGPISRMTDEFRGVVEYPRAPSYERVWKEERLNRERRESDPSYPLYNRDREFDSPMERTSSVRESFPPPGNRGPREFRNQTWSDPRANDEMLEEPLGGPPRGRIGRESFGREMPREFSRDLQRDRDLPVRDGPPGYPRRDYYQPPMRGRGRGGYEGRGGFYRGPDGHGPPFERYAPRDGVPPREGPPYPRREYYPHPMRGRGRRGR